MNKLIIDCISDTHTQHNKIKLPGGDILIHSGDCTSRGLISEAIAFLDWFADQDYSHLIMTAGNHDWIFEQNPILMADECRSRGIVLLNDSGIIIKDMYDPAIHIKIWGSPIQPWFHSWAFNRHKGEDIKKHWDLIPVDTEILVTHGPPHQILDAVPRSYGSFEHCGCKDLLEKIYQTKVKLHVFGHIHEGAGVKYFDGRTYVNASSLDGRYRYLGPGYRRIIRENNSYYEEDLP
jgi:predicted phosphodiesterase